MVAFQCSFSWWEGTGEAPAKDKSGVSWDQRGCSRLPKEKLPPRLKQEQEKIKSVGSGHLLHICEMVKKAWEAEEMPLRHSLPVWTVGGTSQVPCPGTDLAWSSWICGCGSADRTWIASLKYLLSFFNLADERLVECF